MRHFGNDSDGFTMVDFISLIIVLTTIVLIFIGIFLPEHSARVGEYLEYLKIPFWSVLASYFGATIIIRSIPFVKTSYTKLKTMMKKDE
jgi:hypothetical protein